MKPPLLPFETLRRVLRVARFDGMLVLGVAGAFALVCASVRDIPGSVIGLMVSGAGALELHGATLLRSGQRSGVRWLVASQIYLMFTILGYAASRLLRPDISAVRQVVTAELADQIHQAGFSVDQFLVQFIRLVYLSLAAATLLYQGGLAVYYVRRRTAIETAIDEDA